VSEHAFEATLLWLLAALVALLVVVPYALAFRRRRRADRARLAEARELGLDRPVAQFPSIRRAASAAAVASTPAPKGTCSA
jgi:hypothetical protein